MRSELTDFNQYSPSELASLVKKENLIFFDSAGNIPDTTQAPISIIAAQPQKTLTGHLSDLTTLQKVFDENNSKQTIDSQNYPTGGLAGWIDYEGYFHFGVYDTFSIFDHHLQRWVKTASSLPLEKKQPNISLSDWTSDTTQEQFETIVKKAQSHIKAGDIYQVNLAHSYTTQVKQGGSLYPLYDSLRKASPAPMSCYAKIGGKEILSSSPETFLKINQTTIETSPIKGTIVKQHNTQLNQKAANTLLNSEKENAELLMITDLLRNDLGMVCKYGSIEVKKLLHLQNLEHIYHLSSTVQGQLKKKFSHLKALQSMLPGGSITGAPKKRALEIIEALEKSKRGLYTGTIGYIGYNGQSQFNIAIRTLIREHNHLSYHVGAGIVADSIPSHEYQETLIKAKGIQKALASYTSSTEAHKEKH